MFYKFYNGEAYWPLKIKNISNLIPSQKQINNLLQCYQDSRFDDAEEKALSITKKFPKHHFAWKILGIIYLRTGRLSDALSANKKAIEISPKDSETYNILSVIYKELGRLEEAKSSCLKAIELNPGLFQAHINLGNILKMLGKLENAKDCTYKH